MIRFLLALTFAGLLACTSTGSSSIGKDFAKADFAWIVPGTTTRDEVVARHGTPTQVTATDEGMEQFVYSHIKSTTTMKTFGGMSNIDTQQKFAQIWIDPEGKVVRWTYTGTDLDSAPTKP